MNFVKLKKNNSEQWIICFVASDSIIITLESEEIAKEFILRADEYLEKKIKPEKFYNENLNELQTSMIKNIDDIIKKDLWYINLIEDRETIYIYNSTHTIPILTSIECDTDKLVYDEIYNIGKLIINYVNNGDKISEIHPIENYKHMYGFELVLLSNFGGWNIHLYYYFHSKKLANYIYEFVYNLRLAFQRYYILNIR